MAERVAWRAREHFLARSALRNKSTIMWGYGVPFRVFSQGCGWEALGDGECATILRNLTGSSAGTGLAWAGGLLGVLPS